MRISILQDFALVLRSMAMAKKKKKNPGYSVVVWICWVMPLCSVNNFGMK
jgi:hypothetical protein